MNLRVTIGLGIALVIVILVGVLIAVSGGDETPKQVEPQRDAIYSVPERNIDSVTITHDATKLAFVKDANGTFHFDTMNGEAVFQDRWSGITLLLSGPRYSRLIAAQGTDLALYGLDRPTYVIQVGLGATRTLELRLGTKTPQEGAYYVQVKDNPSIYLLDVTFGQVMERLVTTPPRQPTATPPPTPEPSATPGTPVATATR